MADEIDQAQACNEDFQAFALQMHRINRENGNYTGEYCIDCEAPIPPERRRAAPGCLRCIDCQNDYELELRRNPQ